MPRLSAEQIAVDAASTFPVVTPSAYQIERELARGGMGRVLVAEDKRLARPVALKELLANRPDLAARFEREAMITARLQHPAIVPVYEAGRWPSGERFYAMKLVGGRPLDQVIAATPTLAGRIALIPAVIAVCDALAYAHEHRIIHRDLKPHNILVGEFGETIVVDWGIAKDLAAPDDEAEGSIVGTPAYMPPEQAEGRAVDARADVYSLGTVLYHVLSGRPPYEGASSVGLLEKVREEAPPTLSALVPDVPAELAAIVDKAMARDAALRYANASALVEDLRRFQTGQLVGVHHYTFGQLVRRWARRYRGMLAVAGVAAAILAVVGAIAILKIFDAKELAERSRDEATAKARELSFEVGRREWIDGHLDQAAVHLGQAYEGPQNRSLSLLLGLLQDARIDTRRIELAGVNEKRRRAWFVEGAHEVIIDDGTPRSFDTATGKPLARARLRDQRLAAVSPTGRFVLTESTAHAWQLWDGDTPRTIAPLEGATPDTTAIARDGSRVVSYAKGAFRIATTSGVRSVAFDEKQCNAMGWQVTNIMCDDTCRHVVAGGDSCAVLLATDTDTVKVLADWGTFSVSVARDGARVLAVAMRPLRFSYYAGEFADPGRFDDETETPHEIQQMIPDEAVTLVDGGGVVLLSNAGNLIPQQIGLPDINGARATEDGARIAARSWDGSTEIWSTWPDRVVYAIERAPSQLPMDIAPDGSALLIGATLFGLPAPDAIPSKEPSSEVVIHTHGIAVADTWKGDDFASTIVEWVGDPMPGESGVPDPSPDGSRAIHCVDAACTKRAVIDLDTHQVVSTTLPAERAWLATRDWLVTDGDAHFNTIVPVTGGPARELRGCRSQARGQFWLSADASRAVCRTADAFVLIDVAHPEKPLKSFPCDFSFHTRLVSQQPDRVEVHDCATQTLSNGGLFGNDFILRAQDGTALCADGFVSDTSDGTACIVVEDGRIITRDLATGTERARFGTKIVRAIERHGLVYGLDPGGIVSIWDRDRGALLATRTMLDFDFSGFSVSDDGATVLVDYKADTRERWRLHFERRDAATVRAALATTP